MPARGRRGWRMLRGREVRNVRRRAGEQSARRIATGNALNFVRFGRGDKGGRGSLPCVARATISARRQQQPALAESNGVDFRRCGSVRAMCPGGRSVSLT